MQRPGDKDAMLWHLGDQLVSDASPESLQISAEVRDIAVLRRFLRLHKSVVVISAGQSSRDTIRAASQQLVLSEQVPGKLLPGKPKSGKGDRKLPRRKTVFFVVAS